MKVKISDPVIVAMGPSYEEVGWGPWQFPSAGFSDDGRVMVGVHVEQDSAETFGVDRLWFASEDKGDSWYPVSAEEAACAYTKAPSGDRLRCCECPPEKELEAAVAGVHMAFEQEGHGEYFMFDDLNPGYIDKKFKFYRVKAGESERKIEYNDIAYWPNQPICRQKNGSGVMRPFLFGKLRVAPDGSLWHTHYMYGNNPETGEPTNTLTAYFFRSVDNGKSWKLISWLDPRDVDGAYVFCEIDIAWTKKGKAIALLRAKNIFIAESDDGGYTWNKPRRLLPDEDWIEGVDPAITVLNCGGAVASYGRPHFFISTSTDPDSGKWDGYVDLCSESCGYSDVVAISDNEAIVAFVDFRHPVDGGTRKTLKVVRVTFTED